ncbi:hypothetical protein [Massilibacterium senegalense]|uniref:hypothetical protein n=1 Tax=Massilibacterium senegalense TaxID=1632858 RepID=UPI000781EBF3|nr:hypothetical protein [Massilibacterium senegalense]
MRNEIVYFLTNVQDELVMTSVIENLDFQGLTMLFHYLQSTEKQTEQKWLNVFHKTIEKRICS